MMSPQQWGRKLCLEKREKSVESPDKRECKSLGGGVHHCGENMEPLQVYEQLFLTWSHLGSSRSAAARTLLRHQHYVIQTARLQLLYVGGALVWWHGHLLTGSCSVAGRDGQAVAVYVALRRLPLDHSRGRGGLDDLEVGGARDDCKERRRTRSTSLLADNSERF